jgi:sodium-dependent dicarboxylate transporter 2/3/5
MVTPQNKTKIFRQNNSLSQPVRQIALIVVLTLIGYSLAPPDLTTGAYVAQIHTTIAGQTISLDFPFAIGAATGAQVTKSVTVNGITLMVMGNEQYRLGIGERLRFQVRVVDGAGQPVPLALDATGSHLVGPAYQQSLPPTTQVQDDAGTWLLFTMRMPLQAKTTLALLFAVAGLWLTELIPLAASALLIPVVAVVTGIASETAAFQAFADPIIMLFLAGFLMAEAMRRTGLDRWVALAILQRSSAQPAYLMLTLMALTAFLSMWMSNTAAAAITIPIALAILAKIPDEKEPTGFRKALILAVAYSAIGTPANMLAVSFLNKYTGAELAFADWFAFGLPMVLLMTPLVWLYLLFTFGLNPWRVNGAISHSIQHELYATEFKQQGPLGRDQKLVMGIFLGVMALWLTEEWHGISTAIVAIGGALLLFLLRLVKEGDLNQINWNALLTFGGGLAIGTLLVNTGVSDWIALQLVGLNNLPAALVVFLVAGLTLLLGAFISNTACAAMLIPLAIPLAQLLGLDPRLLVAVVAIGSSIDFALVIGTPPTMLAYATGFFRTSEIFRRGLLLDLIGLLLLSFGVIWIWWLLGAVRL